MPILNNRAYFSVTSLALNDINVKGGNVIEPPHEKYVLVTVASVSTSKRELSPKTTKMRFMLVLENTVYLPTSLQPGGK